MESEAGDNQLHSRDRRGKKNQGQKNLTIYNTGATGSRSEAPGKENNIRVDLMKM